MYKTLSEGKEMDTINWKKEMIKNIKNIYAAGMVIYNNNTEKAMKYLYENSMASKKLISETIKE